MSEQKVLIADDEPLNLVLYTEMLKSEGYNIQTANDGMDAVEKAMDNPPDLIILDWNMPRMDGLEALKNIKNEKRLESIPVIIITGIMTSTENLKEALGSGALDFLRKPINKIELLARVKSGLLLAQTINDLKDKLETIEKKNLFINALIKSIPSPMVYYNMNGFIEGYNQQFIDLFEAPPTGFKGISVHNVMHSSVGVSHIMSDRKMVQSGEDISYETVTGNNKRDFIVSKTIYRSTDEKPLGILCILTDITELKKANTEIVENKTRELATTALRMAQLAEMNNYIIADLETLLQHTDSKGNELIKNIIKNFSISSSKSIWQEFETRFEQVYESFYFKLTRKFPDLTQGERKLCALLRLNMTSKEIAALTFQNPQSVDMARYRLRKKLNLAPDENLVDFLLDIE